MKPLYYLGRVGYRVLFKFYCRWRVYNPGRMPQTGPVILAANHLSVFDPPLVGSGMCRDISFLARKTLFRYPVLGWILHQVNAVPVDRDGGGAAGLRAILDRLNAGGAVLLFPEGTRSRDGGLQPARSGVGLAVIKSNASVVPVRVFGTAEAWGRSAMFPRPRKVAVKYGRPMRFEPLRAEAENCPKARLKEIYQQVADEIMAEIAKLEPVAEPD